MAATLREEAPQRQTTGQWPCHVLPQCGKGQQYLQSCRLWQTTQCFGSCLHGIPQQVRALNQRILQLHPSCLHAFCKEQLLKEQLLAVLFCRAQVPSRASALKLVVGTIRFFGFVGSTRPENR